MAAQANSSRTSIPAVPANKDVRVAEGYTRGDLRIINAVDIFIPMAAKAITANDICQSCTHLIHRVGASICRKATILGRWPTDVTAIDAKSRCSSYVEESNGGART